MNKRKELKEMIVFLGAPVCWLLFFDVILGVCWFGIESGFLLILQGFLISLGLIKLEIARIPDWYPHSFESNLLILLLFGALRAVLVSVKKHIPVVASTTFVLKQRLKISEIVFLNTVKHSTSDVISVFGDLSSKAGQYILNLAQFLIAFITLVCLLLLSLKIAFWETVLSFTTLIILMLPLRKFSRRIREDGEGLIREWESANMTLINGMNNIFLLTIYKVAGREFSALKTKLEKYDSHYQRYSFVSSVIMGVPVFLGVFIMVLVTYLSKSYFHTESVMFVGFLYLLLRIAQTASGVSVSYSHFLFYRKSFMHLYNFTKNADAPCKQISVNGASSMSTSVRFDNVAFGYNESRMLFSSLSFDISEGQLLLIKGPSGIGKSTIIKLLLGFFEPSIGKITIGGLSPIEFLQSQSTSVGYVGPEPFLIPGTLKENLLYGNLKQLKDEEVLTALDYVGLRTVVESFNLGLNEYLFEDTQLSTGQKQRLSFARALLRNPRLLILDEATANIDLETEQMILKNVLRDKTKMTTVVISHKESFDDISDRIVTLA